MLDPGVDFSFSDPLFLPFLPVLSLQPLLYLYLLTCGMSICSISWPPPPPYLRPDVLWVAPSAIKTKTHTRFDRQKSSNSHYMFAISALSDRERGRSMRVRCRTTITISSILGGCLATPSPLHPNSPTLQEVNLEQTALTYPLLNSAKHGQDWIYRAISAVDSRC